MKPFRPTLLARALRLSHWRNRLLPVLLAAAGSAAMAAVPADHLTMLLPDNADLNSWQVRVWVDSAAEEGIKLELITDSQLRALGSSAASKISGLIVPDSAHITASAAVVAAIKQYAYTGGKLMLVYDAGVLTDGGFYPPTGNSRFADMVGVDYAFWNNGAGSATMVGFGPVVGTQARLDALSLPPGKYVPYSVPTTLATTTASTTAYVPATAADPSGTVNMAETVAKRARGIDDGSKGVRAHRAYALRSVLGLSAEGSNALRYGIRNLLASRSRDQHVYDGIGLSGDEVAAKISADSSSANEVAASANSTLQAVSGYGYGALGYFHYVTTGDFPGKVQLSSPEHGLVAGNRSYGSGQLLYVNMPLGYFKAIGTDGALLHGFLNQFAREQVGIPSMAVVPRAKGGLIYNWHIDDGDDLTSNTKDLLEQTSLFKRGPFSIQFTAGPDVINFGDGNGMDLNNNTKAQALVRKLRDIDVWNTSASHELGSHGGWIHDYWGLMASEANVPDLTYLLKNNFEAIEKVTGKKIKEYSSPVGNTPTWAVKWMEARGVTGMYLVGDLGAATVRPWRAGKRLTDKLWSFPVTPLGKFATFEEFDDNGVTDVVSGQWLLDLQSFAVNHRTERLFYNHPPGALGHLGPVNALLTRSDRLQAAGKFAWYTMAGMSEFSQRRVETSWSTGTWFGMTIFSASHATSLANQTWMLPKSHYTMPVVTGGWGSVAWDNKNWLVTAEGGTSIKFASFGF